MLSRIAQMDLMQLLFPLLLLLCKNQIDVDSALGGQQRPTLLPTLEVEHKKGLTGRRLAGQSYRNRKTKKPWNRSSKALSVPPQGFEPWTR